MEEQLLKVRNLKTYFYTEEGVVPAVDGLDFDLYPNETLAIVGESGCGKKRYIPLNPSDCRHTSWKDY